MKREIFEFVGATMEIIWKHVPLVVWELLFKLKSDDLYTENVIKIR